MDDPKDQPRSTARDNGLAPGWMMATEKETGARVYVWAPSLNRMRDDDAPELPGALVVHEEVEEVQRRHVRAMLRWEQEKRRDRELVDQWQRFAATSEEASAPARSLDALAYHLALCCRSWGVAPMVAMDYGRNLAQCADGETTPNDVFDSLRERRRNWPDLWSCLDDDAAMMLAGDLHAAMARHLFEMSKGAK